jgi:FtsZ-interacting cell division protein ZipA
MSSLLVFVQNLKNKHMPTKTTAKKVTKTTAKKEPAKKATTAKATTKPKTVTSFKAMVCASDGECFWTRDGRILQNLEDLHLAFGTMDHEVFLHHVQKEKNDFADWVEHVLQDLDCAVALRKAEKLAQAQKITAAHIKKYSS